MKKVLLIGILITLIGQLKAQNFMPRTPDTLSNSLDRYLHKLPTEADKYLNSKPDISTPFQLQFRQNSKSQHFN